MKKILFIIVVCAFTALLISSCKNDNPISKNETDISAVIETNESENDSIAIMQSFKNAKSNIKFIEDLALDDGDHFSWNDDLIKILRGDLDGDGTEDALLFFSIEGRGGGNNWDAHYAAFTIQDNQWKYISQISAGGDWAEYILFLENIKNGKITGSYVGNKDESLPEIPVEYILRNGKFINTYTGLQKTDDVEREFLSINEILNRENFSIPLFGTLEECQALLGKGNIIIPEEQPGCGTYFDEGIISYLEYPHLKFELNDKNEVAWITVEMPNSGMKVQTYKGTITEKTTLEELKSIFYRADSWWTFDDNDLKTFAIPDGSGSDNQFRFLFDKNGKLLSISLFVPC